jgi:hypothetical protein
MLAAMEDLLDSWPGTLLVVSHDRYLLERVTDQQYAVLDGRLRHLPGGVDEYLRLAAGRVGAERRIETREAAAGGLDTPAAPTARPALAGAAKRDAEKELASLDRRLAKLGDQISAQHREFAEHDQSDYVGLGALQARLAELESETATLEERWLQLSEQLEG